MAKDRITHVPFPELEAHKPAEAGHTWHLRLCTSKSGGRELKTIASAIEVNDAEPRRFNCVLFEDFMETVIAEELRGTQKNIDIQHVKAKEKINEIKIQALKHYGLKVEPKPAIILNRDLQGLLQTLPDDAAIVLSKDSEGNRYSPMNAYDSTDDIEAHEGLTLPADIKDIFVLYPTH